MDQAAAGGVAAEGPLWGPGGDRGLYKTTDGGKNWENMGLKAMVQAVQVLARRA